jgi:hypothetical protein
LTTPEKKGGEEMNFLGKRVSLFILPVIVFVLLLGCKGVTPPPVSPAAKIDEPPPLQVTLAPTLPAMLGILKTRIYFSGSGYIPNEMVVVEMEVPPGVEIPAVKPGEPVGVAFAQADETGKFTADVSPSAKILTFLRGNILPTLAPDPKSFKPIPYGIYVFAASGAESGRVSKTRIEFVPPEK